MKRCAAGKPKMDTRIAKVTIRNNVDFFLHGGVLETKKV